MDAVFFLPAGLDPGIDTVALVDGEIAVSGFDVMGAVVGTVAADEFFLIVLAGHRASPHHNNSRDKTESQES